MFFCTGCQNVQAIEPSPVATVAPVASTSATASPDPVPVCAVADAGLDAQKDVIGSEGVVTAEHPPLPPSTPDSEEDADEADRDTRMPVNRVASTFDYSNYGQKFTVHTIPSSDLILRAYEGLPEKYVTIDTTQPVTISLANLRNVVNSIQPDPEKKCLEGKLLFITACFLVSVALHFRK